jgi:hypothetical protein
LKVQNRLTPVRRNFSNQKIITMLQSISNSLQLLLSIDTALIGQDSALSNSIKLSIQNMEMSADEIIKEVSEMIEDNQPSMEKMLGKKLVTQILNY